MPLPASHRALKALGVRLVDGTADSKDLELLHETLIAFDQTRELVHRSIEAIEWPFKDRLAITSRTKSNDTLLEKLLRMPSLGLSKVQDIAGVRVVIDGTLTEQDQIAAALCELSCWEQPARLVDRRADPVQGYRAVHIRGVAAAGMGAEVQVRTRLQDAWANMYEKLADRWGREMRYPGFVSPISGVNKMAALAQQISLELIAPTEHQLAQIALYKQRMRRLLTLSKSQGLPLSSETVVDGLSGRTTRETLRYLSERRRGLQQTQAQSQELLARFELAFSSVDEVDTDDPTSGATVEP